MVNKQDEEKAAAANYIINFYNEVQVLTHHYATYENLMLELSEKYGSQEDKVSEEEKNIIKQSCSTIRYYTTVAFIKYSSIMLKTENKVDKDIETLHDTIKKDYVTKRQDILKYVIKLNGVLMNTVIKSLLENSSDVIAKLYGEDTPKK
jgi:hypothetical protein